MIKTPTMDAVYQYDELDGEGTVLSGDITIQYGNENITISNRYGALVGDVNVDEASVQAFDGAFNDDSDDEHNTNNDIVRLPKYQLVVATKSAQAGISSNWIKYAKKKGIPSSVYEIVQELGRVDRQLSAEPGSNTYEVHMSFANYQSIFIRIMQVESATEQRLQLFAMEEVLKFLVTRTTCYHSFMETYFERESRPKTNCGEFCSYCLGTIDGFTKRIY